MGLIVTAPLRAIYYPYSRTMSEITLKRAVLLYDELIFVDSLSSRARVGLFQREQLPYLPKNVAIELEQEWQLVKDRYQLLEEAGLLRLVDPGPVVEDPAKGTLIGNALCADLQDTEMDNLFGEPFPTCWSMLRSRIPLAAFEHLEHQISDRVLSAGHLRAKYRYPALFLDGRPDAEPATTLVDDGREYAALLPHFAGSSIAISTALALAEEHDAIPLTDSDAHFKFLSHRLRRAASAMLSAADLPGLTRRPDMETAQKTALIQRRVIDQVISHNDLDALTIQECLEYREKTAESRSQFLAFLREMVHTVYAKPWSHDLEWQIDNELEKARKELTAHAQDLRDAYKKLFKRSLIRLSIDAAPRIVASLFPAVSPLAALLFGGGPLTGILKDPVRDLLDLWASRDMKKGSLTYLMDLPKK